MTESSVSLPKNTAKPVTTAPDESGEEQEQPQRDRAAQHRTEGVAIALEQLHPDVDRDADRLALLEPHVGVVDGVLGTPRVRATRLGSRSDESSTG